MKLWLCNRVWWLLFSGLAYWTHIFSGFKFTHSGVWIQWNGMVNWNGGMDWNGGMEW